jgi:hypothetical protein
VNAENSPRPADGLVDFEVNRQMRLVPPGDLFPHDCPTTSQIPFAADTLPEEGILFLESMLVKFTRPVGAPRFLGSILAEFSPNFPFFLAHESRPLSTGLGGSGTLQTRSFKQCLAKNVFLFTIRRRRSTGAVLRR